MNTKKYLIYFITLYMILCNFSTTIYAVPETTTEIITENSSETTTDITSDHTTETTTEGTGVGENKTGIVSPEGTELDIAAEACILIDADTGVILYEKNSHERLYPASITKVLTTLLAVEYGKFDETVIHSHNAVFGIGYGSSHIGMDEGEEVNFRDALYGILLESANEVCMAIAEHIDGDVDTFVEHMNTRAKELGAQDTHFANPHGFHDDNHYTTAYDMSLFVRAAVANSDFLEIFSTVDHTIPATNKNVERPLHNKDRMMRPTSEYYYENIIGGKTGYTTEAGNTLVTYAGKDDIKLITVVMNDPGAQYTYSDTVTLMEYGFGLYEDKILFPAGSYSSEIPVTQIYKDKTIDRGNVTVTTTIDYDAFVPKFIDVSSIDYKANMDSDVHSPLSVGDKVGTLDLFYNNYMIGSADLVTTAAIESIPDETLRRQEQLESLKVITLKVLKIIIIVILSIILILLLLRMFFAFKRQLKRRRRGYNSRYNKRQSKRKSKYKLKIK